MRPIPKMALEEIRNLRNQGHTLQQIATIAGCSQQAISKRLKKAERRQLPATFQTLTPPQQNFVIARASGASATQAALHSYNCRSLDSAKSIGSQLLKKPEIQAAMSDWLEWQGLGREQRAQKLAAFTDHPDPSISFPALKEAMKAGADYPATRLEIDKRDVVYVISLDARDRLGEPPGTWRTEGCPSENHKT